MEDDFKTNEQTDISLENNDNVMTSDNIMISKESNTEKERNITEDIRKKKNEISIKGKTIDEVYDDLEKNPSLKTFDSYKVKRKKNIISLENDDNDFEEHFLFKKNLTIYYKNYSTSNGIITLFDSEVKSSLQIEKTMEIYNIKNLIYEKSKNRTFPQRKDILSEYVNENELIINFICPIDELKYRYNNFYLEEVPQIINLNELSKYSNKYIVYSDNKIEYIETEQRKKFFSYLNDFIRIKACNFFKITGPSNDGKTITLLLFSRLKNNIIYFNLKYIMKLFNEENNEYLKVIIYELGRASLSSETITSIEKIFQSPGLHYPWKLISKIINFLMDESKIIILDQFKEKTVDFNIFNEIEKKLMGKKLKIIICSSIDDYKVKSELLLTIINYHGNPDDLNEETQKFYFYFTNLLGKEKLKKLCESKNLHNIYFDYFDYNPKYIHMFINSKDENITLDNIKKHIKEKIKESFEEKNVSFEEILYFCSLNVGKSLDYIEDFHILKYIPLKYFNLELNKNFYKFDYSFKYIKNLSEELKLDKDIEDFFQNDKPNNSNFYKELRPYYYEESCISSLKKENKLNNNCFQINVKTIAELEEVDNLNQLNKEFFVDLKQELSLKEYYTFNIETINKIIQTKDLKNKKAEEDIYSYHFQALKEKKNDFQNYLKKKRVRTESKKGKDEIVDIENNKIKIYNYKNSFCDGGIFINQEQKTGKTLDFGFLYGKKESKTFIGFHIKCYSNNVKLKKDIKNNLNKAKIKQSISKLLAQALISYNIFINEWHYFMISLYEPKTHYYNKDIVDTCKSEGLEYIFYNPKLHYFYDKNFNKIEGQIQLTFNSNLSYDKEFSSILIFENFHNVISNNNEYYPFSTYKKKLYEKAELFIKKVTNKLKLKNLNEYIKRRFNNKKNLNLISISNFSKMNPFPIPNNNYLLLFINLDCSDFIYYYQFQNLFYCGYILKQKDDEIFPFYVSKYVNTDEEKSSFLIYKFN